MKFSIITVALNPGEKLMQTLNSVFSQTCEDYEIILKDGGSQDGSTDCWKQQDDCFKEDSQENSDDDIVRKYRKKVRFYEEKDTGIYDAMNQAVVHALGEYILFLNCGDVLADTTVLEKAAIIMECEEKKQALEEGIEQNFVFYGDTFSEKTGVTIASAPQITGFTCYRNIPCHQSCFYSAELCRKKPYDLRYRIRADYDHFLWCYYQAGTKFIHMDIAISSYEGGGFSENKANMERDRQEHKLITSTYMSKQELRKYILFMAFTLAPVRKAMAESKIFSKMYHKVKQLLYQK